MTGEVPPHRSFSEIFRVIYLFNCVENYYTGFKEHLEISLNLFSAIETLGGLKKSLL